MHFFDYCLQSSFVTRAIFVQESTCNEPVGSNFAMEAQGCRAACQ